MAVNTRNTHPQRKAPVVEQKANPPAQRQAAAPVNYGRGYGQAQEDNINRGRGSNDNNVNDDVQFIQVRNTEEVAAPVQHAAAQPLPSLNMPKLSLPARTSPNGGGSGGSSASHYSFKKELQKKWRKTKRNCQRKFARSGSQSFDVAACFAWKG